MCTYVKIFSTSYTCQMWRNFRFLHICHVEKFEITQHLKCQISPHLSCGKTLNYSTIGDTLNYSTSGEISDFSAFITHRNLKFLHMKKIAPHISLVIATNMRYGESPCQKQRSQSQMNVVPWCYKCKGMGLSSGGVRYGAPHGATKKHPQSE